MTYQPASLTSMPGKIMEQMLLEGMSKPTEDKEVMSAWLPQGQVMPD